MDSALTSITIQQMLVFEQVVESGGFAKASKLLNMTQSAVSKSIAKLERELDITLFIRTTRNVYLTDAGKILYEDWHKHLESINDSYIRARSVPNYENNYLHIGILNTARPEMYFWDIEEKVGDLYPDLKLDISSAYMTDLVETLKNGGYDIVMVPDFERFILDNEGLCWKWATRSNACLIMNSEHRLAKKGPLEMKEILNEEFAMLEMGNENSYLRDLKERFLAYGVEPKVVAKYENAYEIRYLFRKQKDTVLFTDNYFDCPQADDIVKVPVLDSENGIICAWNPNNVKPSTKKFLSVLKCL